MAHVVKELLQDCSTADSFCFSLRCEECGELWRSRRVPFSKADARPESDGEDLILEALYKREKETARLQAVKQAEQSFSMCPICRRLVCDKCFMVCDNLDMCVRCAGKLQEPGETVV